MSPGCKATGVVVPRGTEGPVELQLSLDLLRFAQGRVELMLGNDDRHGIGGQGIVIQLEWRDV